MIDEKVSKGVVRTSIMIGTIRTLLSNTYVKNIVDNNLNQDEYVQLYSKNVLKNNPYYAKIHKSITIFDPYAYFLCNEANECNMIISDSFEEHYKSNPEIFKIKSFISQLEEGGLPTNLSPLELRDFLIKNYSPLMTWNLLLFDHVLIYMGARLKLFDHIILENLKNYQQFVILGAGMDTRALRLNFSKDQTVWELDFPETFHYKTRILDEAVKVIPKASECRNVYIPCDLIKDNWVSKLEESGFSKDKPTLWILEGLMMYLTEEDGNKLLKTASSISAPSSAVAVMTLTNGEIDMEMAASNILASRIKQIFKSYSENPEQIVSDCGFSKDLISYNEESILKLFGHPEIKLPKCTYAANFTIGFKP